MYSTKMFPEKLVAGLGLLAPAEGRSGGASAEGLPPHTCRCGTLTFLLRRPVKTFARDTTEHTNVCKASQATLLVRQQLIDAIHSLCSITSNYQ